MSDLPAPAVTTTPDKAQPWAPALTIITWLAAIGSCWLQKSSGDDLITSSADISAIQIQQINGQTTAHCLVVLVIALGATFSIAALRHHFDG